MQSQKIKKFEEHYEEKYGFKMILPNETSIEQLVKMLTKCRLTCKHFMKENLDIEIPIELKQLGGCKDEVEDQFGEKYKVYDVSSGKSAAGALYIFWEY